MHRIMELVDCPKCFRINLVFILMTQLFDCFFFLKILTPAKKVKC